MADERKEDSSSDEQEERRVIRKNLRNAYDDMQENKRQMADLHSTKIEESMRNLKEAGENASKTRELQLQASCLKEVTAALKAQATSLCDMSGRFNWQDLSTKARTQFRNAPGMEGFNWEMFGCEARVMFNCISSFNTMAGPIYKEERVRKLTVRRQRDDNSNVENVTGQVIENHEEDGNDEATNARVANLLQYLESLQGEQFDLLKTLVDPSNPVQSVENFFDYSYLHKEKRVIHDVDQDTGLLNAKLAHEEELENRQKSQMVLSFSMRDMEQMARLVYPEYFEEQDNGTTSEPSSHSSHGPPSSNGSSSSSSAKRAKLNPLHREDDLYDAVSAQEQVKILHERAHKQAEQAKQNAGAGPSKKAGPSRPSASQPAQGSRRSTAHVGENGAPSARDRAQPSATQPGASSSSAAAGASRRTCPTATAAASPPAKSSRAGASKAGRRTKGGRGAAADHSDATASEEEGIDEGDAEDEGEGDAEMSEEEVVRPAPARTHARSTSNTARKATSPVTGTAAVSTSSKRFRAHAAPFPAAPEPAPAPVHAVRKAAAMSSPAPNSHTQCSPSFTGTPKPSAATTAANTGTPALSAAVSASVSVKVELNGMKRTRSEPQQGKENNAYSPTDQPLPADVDLFPSTDSQGSGSSKSDGTPIGRKSRRLA